MGDQMENEIVNHDTIYPASASEGGDNAYYLRGCEVVQRSPAYASCLYKIAEKDAGRTSELHGECHNAGGRCAARAMRDEERLQGKALYYFPRKHPEPAILPFKVAGDFGVLITNLTDPALIPRSPNSTPTSRFMDTIKKLGDAVVGKPAVQAKKSTSVLDSIDTGTYADAINTPAPVAKKPLTKDDLAKLAQPGESLIDTAKRLLNKTKDHA